MKISLLGIDGSGKSTLSGLLKEYYQKEGYEAAKKIVKEFLLPQRGKEDLSYN